MPLPRSAARAALAAALLLAMGLAYAPGLRGAFQFDDLTSIQANYAIRSPASLLAGLTPEALLGPGRPVTDLAFALAYAAGGLDPLPFHLLGLGAHAAVAGLGFLLLRGALRRAGHPRAEPLAALATPAFALHPLHAEAVCYAAQLAEVLAAALSLGALLLLTRAYDAPAARAAAAWAAAATAATALATGAKGIAVVVPAAFLLWAVALGRRPGDEAPAARRAARALLLGAGAWALALGAVWRSLTVLGPGSTAGLHAGALGPWRYLLTQLRVHWHYARLLAWPAGQSVDPAFAPSPAWPDGATLLAAAATLALLAGAALAAARARPPAAPALRAAAFGVAWWYLWLAPTSSVIPIADLVAEHRPYLASMGALLAALVALDALVAAARPSPRARAAAAGLAVAACAALGVALSARVEVWRSPLSLWADAAAKDPRGDRAAANLAFALHDAGRLDEAEAAYLRAQALARTPRQLADVARNLSALRLERGDLAGSLAALEIGLGAAGHDFELRAALANTLRQLGRLDEALAEARRAVSLAPGEPDALEALGLVLLDLGQAEAALAQLRRAADLDPDTPAYREDVLLALARLGRRAEGCAAWAALRAGGHPLHPSTGAAAAALGCPP